MKIIFPQNFLWGTATSSHQVEGGNNMNDWWDWETAGHIKNREISGPACDHFNRFDEDFALAEKFHQNAHRFSIEWSRIEPAEGEFSESAIYHYRQVLESLHRHKLIPMVTLLHFTLPRWVAAKGAWENDQIIAWFERYARKCAAAFGDLVPFWATMNEPMIQFFEAYVMGSWPPGKKQWTKQTTVVRRMIQAHGRAYHAVKGEIERNNWKSSVGLVMYFRVIQPKNPKSPLDLSVVKARDYVFNQLFLNAIETGIIAPPVAMNYREPELKGTWDFIGLNYYTREKVRFNPLKVNMLFSEEVTEEGVERNDMGWEVYPRGIYDAAMALTRFGKPIYITENGICTNDDKQRQSFIIRHLQQIHRAIQDGADIRGYFHWSLLDNFEWAHGYAPHFGLVAVDMVNQRRQPKESLRLFGDIAKSNGVELEEPAPVK